MNPETIIIELRGINAWRRGGEEIEQPDPKHIGEVLDAAADSLASLIASNTTLRRERSEARAEVAQLKGALALGQENCDAEYEALRRERDTARDGLRDSAKSNGELQAEIVRLTVDRDNWSNQAQTELRELVAAQARVKELEELAEARYAQGYSAANRLNTKRREVDQAAYDELVALRAELARVTEERRQEYDELREAGAKRENALRARVAVLEKERERTTPIAKAACEEIDQLRTHVAELVAENTRLTSRLNNAEEAHCNEHARVAELEKELQNQRAAAFHHHERAEQAIARAENAEQRVADLEEDGENGRIAYNLLRDDKARAEQRNAELEKQNELLICDRARFPDKSCEVGNIIAAHLENLKAVSDSNAEALRWACVREKALKERNAELEAALREVDEIVNDTNHSAEDRLCAAANRLLNTRAESATPDHIPDAACIGIKVEGKL